MHQRYVLDREKNYNSMKYGILYNLLYPELKENQIKMEYFQCEKILSLNPMNNV